MGGHSGAQLLQLVRAPSTVGKSRGRCSSRPASRSGQGRCQWHFVGSGGFGTTRSGLDRSILRASLRGRLCLFVSIVAADRVNSCPGYVQVNMKSTDVDWMGQVMICLVYGLRVFGLSMEFVSGHTMGDPRLLVFRSVHKRAKLISAILIAESWLLRDLVDSS